jgi:hypothetical protein
LRGDPLSYIVRHTKILYDPVPRVKDSSPKYFYTVALTGVGGFDRVYA